MSLTDRHKRPGGFRKFVHSLETTPEDRRDKILAAMRAEDPEFVALAVAHMFRFEDFVNIPDMVLCELVVAMKEDSRTMALALFHMDKPLIDKFTRNMPAPVRRAFNEATEQLVTVKANERTAAHFRIIAKARDLESKGLIVVKKYAAPYPDNG